ncbi:hypothetical protein C2G38_2199462 [Gigaspora rosea]|uniref:Uncharacterized protein n=1 Tax=Gigaspora rosea TaxID=44941 RepID=A0A397UU36_9GLOM|nr:hypothetical protein C2G38_2199462 [Gigaspora rosea]
MDIDEILEEEKIEEKSEKLNREYLNSCFNEYMLKLETPSESTVFLEKPQTSEPEEWLRYFSNLMNLIEEYKRDYEWKLVESYIDYAYIVFTEYETCENQYLKKKNVKNKLYAAVKEDKPTIWKSRCRQAFDHIYDMIVFFNESDISREIWVPLLKKCGFTYRFLYESNSARKKTYKFLYENFMNCIILKCKENK